MGILYGNGSVRAFIDIPSVLIVFVTGFCLAFAAHGFLRVLSAVVAGFSPTKVTDEDSARDALILQTLRNTICAAAVVGYIIGVVQMLSNLSDPKSIGPAMAVAILTSLYAMLFGELILGPMVNRLHARAGGSAWSAPSNGSRGAMILIVVIVGHLSVFWLMMHSMNQALVHQQCEELIDLKSSDKELRRGCRQHLCAGWHLAEVRQTAKRSTQDYCYAELCVDDFILLTNGRRVRLRPGPFIENIMKRVSDSKREEILRALQDSAETGKSQIIKVGINPDLFIATARTPEGPRIVGGAVGDGGDVKLASEIDSNFGAASTKTNELCTQLKAELQTEPSSQHKTRDHQNVESEMTVDGGPDVPDAGTIDTRSTADGN